MSSAPRASRPSAWARAAEWEAAQRAGQGYAAWIADRLHRLVLPIAPLLVVRTVVAMVSHKSLGHLGSRTACLDRWVHAPRGRFEVGLV